MTDLKTPDRNRKRVASNWLKRQVVMRAIQEYITEVGYPPTREEIAERVRLSPSAVSTHLKGLEKEGRIRVDHGARAIAVLTPL